MHEVSMAATIKIADPTHPLHEIGRFEAIGTRGIGGFGIVFEVRDPQLDRHVALKLCQTRGPKAADGLMAEAKLLARLSHPNIVTVHEPGRHGDDVFFVMEYVKGVNAHRFATSEPAPSWEQIVDVYRGAGRGLAAAHDAGIVHGDFKPANVLLDQQHRPRVADFGLAQVMLEHASDAEREGLRHRPGTLPFMAPEVLRGHAGGVLSDQWSFCVSLWESLEHVLPFDGGTADELLDAIERGKPWVMKPDVPEAVREVVRVGLSQDPHERYPDMHALLRALDELRQPLPPTPESPPELEPLSGNGASGDGWRGAFFVVTMLLVGTAVFGALSVKQGVRSREAEQPGPILRATKSSARSALPCASASTDSRATVDSKIRGICILIRGGDFDEANSLWDSERTVREPGSITSKVGYGWADLAADTLIIARTFIDEAENLQVDNPAGAINAAKWADIWANQAEDDLKRDPDVDEADSTSSRFDETEHGISEVENRAAAVVSNDD